MRPPSWRAALVTVCALFAALLIAPAASARISPEPHAAAPEQGGVPLPDRPHPVLLAKRSIVPQVIVRPGDTLSKIARRACHKTGFWPEVWWANRRKVDNPNQIYPGQRLRVPACAPVRRGHAAAALEAIPAPPPLPAAAPASPPAGAAAPAAAPAPAAQASYSGGSGFQQCVISRESGGQSQVMNSTGHYGLYQFAAGTWSAYGGNPADFGNASVAEQNQVFANAMATPGGASNWSPYDGCTP